MGDLEKGRKNQRAAAKACNNNGVSKTDFLLKWENRKKLRCLKVKVGGGGGGGDADDDEQVPKKSNNVVKKKINSDFDRSPQPCHPNHLKKNSNTMPTTRTATTTAQRAENLKSQTSLAEKEEKHYITRRSMGSEENGTNVKDGGVKEEGGITWPKLLISLSSKEKEEDFMAMKGCKLPQRPKKRAKLIQKTLLLVSPGAWLSDLCQERYEVKEKETSKKKPRGLKGMGSKRSNSE